MGGGLLDFIATNWIPLGQNHWLTYVAQVVIGLIFSGIYFTTPKPYIIVSIVAANNACITNK
jgi:phosphotransferase system  glucose/maltose/N-acetylglucosamine-specific IIC component